MRELLTTVTIGILGSLMAVTAATAIVWAY